MHFITAALIAIFGKFWTGSVYRDFKLCAIIEAYALIFVFLKAHWVQSLETL